jgi:hypothetical protein
MTRIVPVFALSSALFVCLLASSAQAQVTRTFVSGTGTANSSCSYTAPCRFFTQAVAALPSQGGEIDVLDPGSYGQITITNSVSIVGRGWTTITATPSTAAIAITGSGNVTINGVQLDGGGTGETGISFTGGGSLSIIDSVVRNFATDGISIANTGFNANVTLRDVALLNNTGDGISITPSITVFVSAKNVTANGNGTGVYVSAAAANAYIMMDQLSASSNSNYGVQTVGGAINWLWNLYISNSVLRFNGLSDVYNTNTETSNGGGVYLFDHTKIGVISSSVAVTSDGSNDITNVGATTFTTLSTH